MQPIPGQSVAEDAAGILQSQQNPATPEEGASESAFDFRAGLQGAEPLLQREASERNPLDEFAAALTPGSSQLAACTGSDLQNSPPGGGLEGQQYPADYQT